MLLAPLWALLVLRALGLAQDGALAAKGLGGGRRKVASKPGMYVEVRDMSLCSKKSSLDSFNFTPIFLEKSRTMMFTGYFNVGRDAQAFTKLSATVHQCKGGVSSNTCEYAGAFHPKGAFCPVVMSPAAFWAPLIRSVQPTFHCPPKKGLYRIDNSTVDLSIINRYITDVSADTSWIINGEIEDEQQRSWICGKMTARLVPFGKQKAGP